MKKTKKLNSSKKRRTKNLLKGGSSSGAGEASAKRVAAKPRRTKSASAAKPRRTKSASAKRAEAEAGRPRRAESAPAKMKRSVTKIGTEENPIILMDSISPKQTCEGITFRKLKIPRDLFIGYDLPTITLQNEKEMEVPYLELTLPDSEIIGHIQYSGALGTPPFPSLELDPSYGRWFQFDDDKVANIHTYTCQDDDSMYWRNMMAFKKVIIGEQCEEIEQSTFFRDTGLLEVVFDKSSKLKRIGEYAFYNSGLTKITLPKNLELIEKEAFVTDNKNNQYHNIKCTITLEERQVDVGSNSERAMCFPTNLKRIGESAFKECIFRGEQHANLTTLFIPASIEHMGIDCLCLAEESVIKKVIIEKEFQSEFKFRKFIKNVGLKDRGDVEFQVKIRYSLLNNGSYVLLYPKFKLSYPVGRAARMRPDPEILVQDRNTLLNIRLTLRFDFLLTGQEVLFDNQPLLITVDDINTNILDLMKIQYKKLGVELKHKTELPQNFTLLTGEGEHQFQFKELTAQQIIDDRLKTTAEDRKFKDDRFFVLPEPLRRRVSIAGITSAKKGTPGRISSA